MQVLLDCFFSAGRALLDAVGAYFEGSWAVPGRSWPPLGHSKTHLNAVQVLSKRNLDPTWPFNLLSKGSKMAFGAPSWALHGQHELQLAFQLSFQSAPDLQRLQFSLGKP